MSRDAEALDDIRAAFESDISYSAIATSNLLPDSAVLTIAGEAMTLGGEAITLETWTVTVGPATMPAVDAHIAAPAFQGPGHSARQRIWQIAMADWPFFYPPARGDELNDGRTWRVVDSIIRDDVGAYELSVEAA